MIRHPVLATTLLLALAACKPEPPQVSGWVRATPSGARTGAGYLTVTAPSSDRLIGVTSERAAVSMHETAMKDGIMTMRPITKAVPLPADKPVMFAPGGRHLMFTGFTEPFAVGEKVAVVLKFKRAGSIAAELPVLAAAPEAGHPGH